MPTIIATPPPPSFSTPLDQPDWSSQFFTLDNGGRPFCVALGPKKAKISRRPIVRITRKTSEGVEWTREEYDYSFPYSDVLLEVSPYLRFFVGRGISGPAPFGNPNDPRSEGNSIILQDEETSFIFIGSQVDRVPLMENEKIERFSSLVGNSDVPYPWLVTNQRILQCSEFRCLDRNSVTDRWLRWGLDFTQIFYCGGPNEPKDFPEASEADCAAIRAQSQTIKNLEGIQNLAKRVM